MALVVCPLIIKRRVVLYFFFLNQHLKDLLRALVICITNKIINIRNTEGAFFVFLKKLNLRVVIPLSTKKIVIHVTHSSASKLKKILCLLIWIIVQFVIPL